jgi:hypothetical protein
MDDEVQLAIAWVLQRARELAPECDTAEEFLDAFGSACQRCGEQVPNGRRLAGRELVCDGCLAERAADCNLSPARLV